MKKFSSILSGHFRFTASHCCAVGGGGRRNIQNWEFDERQASGETPIPGTNATVQDVVDSFNRITDRLDEIQVSVELNPSQNGALVDCVNFGLCV